MNMPLHPVAGRVLQVLVLLIATPHQGIERAAVEVVPFALRGPTLQVPAALRYVATITIGDITEGVTLD